MNGSIQNGSVFKFTQRSYNEALSLLVYSRDYFSTKGRLDKLKLSSEDSIYTQLQCQRLQHNLLAFLAGF